METISIRVVSKNGIIFDINKHKFQSFVHNQTKSPTMFHNHKMTGL